MRPRSKRAKSDTSRVHAAEADRSPARGELFPLSPRSVFEHAPLVLTQVICQLRVPTILAIESNVPAQFQERIRSEFPLLQRSAPTIQIPAEIVQLLSAAGAAHPSTLQYSFQTEDQKSTLNLSPDTIALSTTSYTRWEHFRRLMEGPLRALMEIYKPSFFTRIGLRYSNAITPERLGLTGLPWSKLLRHELLGELAIPQFERNLDGIANRTIRMKLPGEDGAVLLRHGLGIVTGAPQPPQPSYMIDLDFKTAIFCGTITPTRTVSERV